MAKKAWLERVKRARSSRCGATTSCQRCGRADGTLRKFKLCRICSVSLRCAGKFPACQSQLVKTRDERH